MSGLYIHIPFCASRCAYCGFYSTTMHNKKAEYTDALLMEIESYKGHPDAEAINTVYFGGGTPSQLSIPQIKSILLKADDIMNLSNVSEMTLECNPDDITSEYLSNLRDTPINRISMGIQSMNDGILSFLNRRHTAEEAVNAIDKCQEAGYGNLSIDLIYGIPRQTIHDFTKDVLAVTDLGIPHISAYCLSYEDGTPLQRMLADGQIQATSDDVCADMYLALCDILHSKGYTHYEISNFCKPGYQSRHNSSYWNGTHYIGIGAGAHSYDGNIRKWNIADIDKYIHGIKSGKPAFDHETLSICDRRNEMIMLSLRTGSGLCLSDFENKFGIQSVQKILTDAEKWIESNDLILDSGNLIIKESSLFKADGIISSLFLEQC